MSEFKFIQGATMTEEAKPGRRERMAQIAALAEEGYSSREIAKRLGVTRQRVCRVAERTGIPLAQPGGTRRVGAWVSRRRFDVLDRIARDAGISRSAMVVRLLEPLLADDATAKRHLGKGALPTRSYTTAGARC